MEPKQVKADSFYRSIAVAYSREEYLDYSLVVQRAIYRDVTILMLVTGDAILAFAALWPREVTVPGSFVFGVLGAALLLRGLAMRVALERRISKLFQSGSPLITARKSTELTPQGVHVVSQDGSNSFTPWTSVTGLKDGKRGLFLMINPAQGILVPRRGFSDDQSYSRFREYALVMLTEAKHSLAPAQPQP